MVGLKTGFRYFGIFWHPNFLILASLLCKNLATLLLRSSSGWIYSSGRNDALILGVPMQLFQDGRRRVLRKRVLLNNPSFHSIAFNHLERHLRCCFCPSPENDPRFQTSNPPTKDHCQVCSILLQTLRKMFFRQSR